MIGQVKSCWLYNPSPLCSLIPQHLPTASGAPEVSTSNEEEQREKENAEAKEFELQKRTGKRKLPSSTPRPPKRARMSHPGRTRDAVEPDSPSSPATAPSPCTLHLLAPPNPMLSSLICSEVTLRVSLDREVLNELVLLFSSLSLDPPISSQKRTREVQKRTRKVYALVNGVEIVLEGSPKRRSRYEDNLLVPPSLAQFYHQFVI